ncbi:hypothetical protein [Microbacterium yannicii]|uniref:hypothetical protein n=1 Tax=Microbacterium yannicii TaxID=671622 RepID=UPI00036FFBED|nr:hypothetical protein [Microbacterium yannicii]
MSFEALLAVVGTVLSVVTVVLAATRSITQAAAFREQARMLESLRVSDVVETTDLHALGSLVVRDLGGTSMSNYVRHEEVRTRFRTAFNAAREFIGEVPERDSENLTEPAQARVPNQAVWGDERLSQSGEKALRDVAEGESWNALARMRRELEIVLASRLDPSVTATRRMAAGQMLAVATKQGAISPESASPLRYALSVANRAVHGEEISADSAVEAILIIDRFIRSL